MCFRFRNRILSQERELEVLDAKANELLGALHMNICESEETVQRSASLLQHVATELRAHIVEDASADDVTTQSDGGDNPEATSACGEENEGEYGTKANTEVNQSKAETPNIAQSSNSEQLECEEKEMSGTEVDDDVNSCLPKALDFSDAALLASTTPAPQRSNALTPATGSDRADGDAEAEAGTTPDSVTSPVSDEFGYVDAKTFFEELGEWTN